jgi:hypothetical protein
MWHEGSEVWPAGHPAYTMAKYGMTGLPDRYDRRVPAAEHGTSPPQQELRFCRSADGVRIAYARHGSGPPLVIATCWLSHLQYDWESPV